MANLYVVYDADHAGRLIGNARMQDDANGLARISNLIDSGNEVFKSWAIEHGGAQISAGGDEGVLEIPATALMDLQAVKLKYEALLDLTVSIGIGLKMSQGFKALLASKLRGRNRTTMYDKEVEKEIEEASKNEDPEKKKIVEEYLEKRQPIHHVGSAGKPQSYHVQEKSANPEMQQAQDIKDMPAAPEPVAQDSHFENSFRQFASDDEKTEQAKAASKSQDLQVLKQKVAQALASMHKQMPMLAQIKQASPETYTAVLGVVQGLVAIGRQISDTEQQLSKSQVNIYHNANLPPTGMLATSTGGFENYDMGMDKADLMSGGLADKKRPEDFDQEQLAIGQTIEAEHTDNPDLAREIAMDHLTEDPNYYKQEGLKKAIANIPKGDFDSSSTDAYHRVENHDFSHLLSPEQKQAGYSINLKEITSKGEKDPMSLLSTLHHKGNLVGGVQGLVHRAIDGPHKEIEPHSEIDKPHQGKGFGVKLYEALYSHAKNTLGIDKIAGGVHSEAAHRVHESLARKHGLGYTASKKGNEGVPYPYGRYNYTLKAEIPSDGLDESKLGCVYFNAKEELDPAKTMPPENVLSKEGLPESIHSMKHHNKLVPGEIVSSRHIVVKTPKGNNSIRQVAEGMVREPDPNVVNPIGPGTGNVTSARNQPKRKPE